jgi:hypothetical protein
MTAVDEQWSVDFATGDDRGGFVRLVRVGDRCWYWCYLVGEGIGLVAVRDHDVAPPRRPNVLEIRADALWAELVCETPDEHWGIGLEAFGLRLDAPIDAWTTEIGDRVAVGLDLEWEVAAGGAPHGVVRGEVLLERDRLQVDGFGVLTHAIAPDTAWPTEWTGWCRFPDGRWDRIVGGTATTDAAGIVVPVEVRMADGTTAGCEAGAVVPVPLEPGPPRDGRGRGPALVRVLTGVVPTREDSSMTGSMTGIGWVEVLQS